MPVGVACVGGVWVWYVWVVCGCVCVWVGGVGCVGVIRILAVYNSTMWV